MSAHTGFLLAAVVSLAMTLPFMAWLCYMRWPHWGLAAALYVCGYVFIGAALVLDPIVQPPLFIHGFVPGVGTGMIVVGLAMGVRIMRARRRKCHAAL